MSLRRKLVPFPVWFLSRFHLNVSASSSSPLSSLACSLGIKIFLRIFMKLLCDCPVLTVLYKWYRVELNRIDVTLVIILIESLASRAVFVFEASANNEPFFKVIYRFSSCNFDPTLDHWAVYLLLFFLNKRHGAW